jgi:hypothetical protein
MASCRRPYTLIIPCFVRWKKKSHHDRRTSPDPECAFPSSCSPSARSDTPSGPEDFEDFRDAAAVFSDGLELLPFLPWPSDDDVSESTCVAGSIPRTFFRSSYFRRASRFLILCMRSSCSISGSFARRIKSSERRRNQNQRTSCKNVGAQWVREVDKWQFLPNEGGNILTAIDVSWHGLRGVILTMAYLI